MNLLSQIIVGDETQYLLHYTKNGYTYKIAVSWPNKMFHAQEWQSGLRDIDLCFPQVSVLHYLFGFWLVHGHSSWTAGPWRWMHYDALKHWKLVAHQHHTSEDQNLLNTLWSHKIIQWQEITDTTFLQNISTYLPDCTVIHPRRQQSLLLPQW